MAIAFISIFLKKAGVKFSMHIACPVQKTACMLLSNFSLNSYHDAIKAMGHMLKNYTKGIV